MNEAIEFCIANRIRFSCITLEDLTPQWTVSNQTSIGFVGPDVIRGTGSSIEEALKLYMTSALDQRATYKEQVGAYVAAPLADTTISDAFSKDERVAFDVVSIDEPVEVAVKG